MHKTRTLTLSALLAVAASPALAHTGLGDIHGFAHGFMHPISGTDHVLAMVTVGLFAATLAQAMGQRAMWLVPASFVVMMIVGGLLGISGVEVPFVELGIVGSVIVLGATVAIGKPWPLGLAMSMVGLFAVFHGHAHGAEMPGGAGAASYGVGFALATALLHGIGISLGLLLGRYPVATRLAGGAVAAAGLGLLVG
jgi:urease accessory protein